MIARSRQFRLLPAALVWLAALNAFGDCVWRGTKDSNFQTAENWENPPKSDSTNQSTLAIANDAAHPLIYTEKDGTTVFTDQLSVGWKKTSRGEMTITGGTLTIQGKFGAIIGQTAKGVLTVTGGALNLLQAGTPVFLGNEADGTWNLSGGTVTIGSDLIISRNNLYGSGNYSGILNITGGKFTVEGQTYFDVDAGSGAGGTGEKKINFGPGAGVFEETKGGIALAPLVFAGGSTAYVNFTTGSKGSLSLLSATKDYFVGLVKAGRIQIDDKPAQPSSFQFTTSGQQGIYSLAH